MSQDESPVSGLSDTAAAGVSNPTRGYSRRTRLRLSPGLRGSAKLAKSWIAARPE